LAKTADLGVGGKRLPYGRDCQISIGNFGLIVFVVLVIIGGQPIIRKAGRGNRIIGRKGLDYEKR